jgi:hypothetical protein
LVLKTPGFVRQVEQTGSLVRVAGLRGARYEFATVSQLMRRAPTS